MRRGNQVTTPRPDHPWYGRNNHAAKKRKSTADTLIDQEIERAILVQRAYEDRVDIGGTELKGSLDPSYMPIEGGLRRVPVRYDGNE